QRSVMSISVNIAEGCSKYSQKDFVRFLQISLGSSYELETYLILCEDLDFASPDISTPLIKKTQKLQMRISSLIKYNNS
ncbi:MAG: four helix bundle protein, partial [Flavobacteriaceae bacterium]